MSDVVAPPPPTTVVERICRVIAILGGFVSLALAGTVCISVAGRKLFNAGVPGDFEFVQIGAALAVFAFLPLGQVRRVNIVVDTFSANWSERTRRFVDAFWDLTYAAMMGVIGYCMINGSIETFRNHTGSMVLQLPLWPSLAVCTLLCLFLSAVTLWTANRLLSARR